MTQVSHMPGPSIDIEASLLALFEAGDPVASDRAVADLVRTCTTASELNALFALEVLEPATIGSEDSHGRDTTEALLQHVRTGRGTIRTAAATLAATLAAPTVSSLLRFDGLDDPKREARAAVAAFEGVAALVADRSARVRAAGWSLLARAAPTPGLEGSEEKLDRSLRKLLESTDENDEVCATMHLARAAARIAPDVHELAHPGLRGWTAAFASTRVSGVASGAAGERLISALRGKRQRVPACWGFGDASTADLTSELLGVVEVDAALIEPALRGMRGEDAPRRIAELAFGAAQTRGPHLVFERLPLPGARPDTLSALGRVVVHRLAELSAEGHRDHHVDSALGLHPNAHAAFLAREDQHQSWETTMAGFEGAPFHWIHRSAVLVGAPTIDLLVRHLIEIDPARCLDLVLARMPRVLLAERVATLSEPHVAWARDAELLDRLGGAPSFRTEITLRLARYRPLQADCPRALGRLAFAAGLFDTPGADARIADARTQYEAATT